MKLPAWAALAVLFVFESLAMAGVTTLSESKQPWEEIVQDIDFSSRLATGDKISDNACTVTATSGGGTDVTDNVVSYDNTVLSDNTSIRLTLKGGSDGKSYKVTVRCTTDNGAKLEEDVKFRVQEY